MRKPGRVAAAILATTQVMVACAGGASPSPASPVGSATASASETASTAQGTPPPIAEAPGLLAISRDGDIYVRRADGSQLQRLTNDPNAIEGPLVWVRNGSQLVVTSHPTTDPNAPTALRLLDLDSGKLTDLGLYFAGPQSWSPDGQQLAFASIGGEDEGIVVVDVQRGSFRQLTHDGGYGYDCCHGPIWSPDGTLIAYEAPDGTGTDVRIVRVADGTVTSPAPDPAADYALRWVVADGVLKLVFGSYRGTDETKFAARPWVMNVDGTDLELFADSGLDPRLADPQPVSYLSPDGRWIASDCESGVCISPGSDMTSALALPETTGWNIAGVSLTWVPGGDYVVFGTGSVERQIVVAFPLMGGELITLTPDGVTENSPAWQPVSGE
jgi:Tol biopolymer transport system component